MDTSFGSSAKAYIHQLSVDTGCNLVNWPGSAGTNGERERESQANLCYQYAMMMMMPVAKLLKM